MLLEVGMELYSGDGARKITITRVTAKRAYAVRSVGVEYDFEREIDPERPFSHREQTSRWHKTWWWHVNKDLIAKYERLQLTTKYQSYPPHALSDDQLRRIIAIFDEGKDGKVVTENESERFVIHHTESGRVET